MGNSVSLLMFILPAPTHVESYVSYLDSHLPDVPLPICPFPHTSSRSWDFLWEGVPLPFCHVSGPEFVERVNEMSGYLFIFLVLKIEPRVLCMLGKNSPTRTTPSALLFLFCVLTVSLTNFGCSGMELTILLPLPSE
jgi:hypothetical protein